jgi:hypothetical protein
MNSNDHTTNKSQRKVGNQFNVSFPNKEFEEKDLKMNNDNQLNKDIRRQKDDINIYILPHQRPMEEIILSIRGLFFKVLEMLIDKQNPIPYIFSTEQRQFSFALFLIIIGAVLLLFSNVMKSPDK